MPLYKFIPYIFISLFIFSCCSDDKKEDPGVEMGLNKRQLLLDSVTPCDTVWVYQCNESFKVIKSSTIHIRNQELLLTEKHLKVTVDGSFIYIERKYFENHSFYCYLQVIDKKGKKKVIWIEPTGMLGLPGIPPDEVEKNLINDHDFWNWNDPITGSQLPK